MYNNIQLLSDGQYTTDNSPLMEGIFSLLSLEVLDRAGSCQLYLFILYIMMITNKIRQHKSIRCIQIDN